MCTENQKMARVLSALAKDLEEGYPVQLLPSLYGKIQIKDERILFCVSTLIKALHEPFTEGVN